MPKSIMRDKSEPAPVLATQAEASYDDSGSPDTDFFAIILLGFLISRTPISSPEVWQGLERLT